MLGSCSPVVKKGFSRQSFPEFKFTPVFNETFEKALYKIDISYSGKNLSGMAMIKKMEENNSFRTVFMSETGLKYFDFEFPEDDSAVVHYVMDAMNRKGLIQTLTTDLGLLLRTTIDDSEATYYFHDKSGEGLIIKEKQKGRNYFYFNQSDETPSQILHRACLSPATDIEINYNAENIPSNIIFTHGILNFKMELKLITE